MSNLDVIEKNARENHVPVMLEDGMEFLVQYIREHEEIVNILEIGTAVGLSSMKMAEIRETIHIDTLEVNEERELKLFKGRAVGPAYKGFDYKSTKGEYAIPFVFNEETPVYKDRE